MVVTIVPLGVVVVVVVVEVLLVVVMAEPGGARVGPELPVGEMGVGRPRLGDCKVDRDKSMTCIRFAKKKKRKKNSSEKWRRYTM